MKPDIYTKAVLTIIAIMLTLIALKPLISPDISAHAEGPFSGVQFAIYNGVPFFFDARTGELFKYSDPFDSSHAYEYRAKLTELGQPFTNVEAH